MQKQKIYLNIKLKSVGQSTSIFVYQDDIYLSGIFESDNYIACYWKNGEKIDLSDETYDSIAYDICIYDDNIYVCGYYVQDDIKTACYWKNGEKFDLSDGTLNSVCTTIDYK